MSYCRWSLNDFQCDLYIYKDCAGYWSVNVASGRYVFKEPLPEFIPWPGSSDDQEAIAAWLERNRTVGVLVDCADMESIGLSRDGQCLICDNPGEAADLVESLRLEGYRCPEEVVLVLREEQRDLDAAASAVP